MFEFTVKSRVARLSNR